MLKMKSLLLGIPSAIVVLSAVLAPVAYARDGSGPGSSDDSSVSASTTNASTSDSSGSGSDRSSTTSPKTETRRSSTDTKTESENESEVDELRHQGGSILSEAEKKHPESNKEDRLKKCEQRKNGIEQRSGSFVLNAQRYLTHINEVSTKVQDYKTTNDLKVADYDALVAAANAAKTQATNSVAAMAALKPVLDCSKDTAPADVATFKAAVAKAKTDLSTYRKSVKTLLVAVQTSKDQGGQQ